MEDLGGMVTLLQELCRSGPRTWTAMASPRHDKGDAWGLVLLAVGSGRELRAPDMCGVPLSYDDNDLHNNDDDNNDDNDNHVNHDNIFGGNICYHVIKCRGFK